VGKPFSQKDFRQIRKELDDRKLLELKNEKDARQGYRLTPDGVLAMERVRDQYAGRTTPPLE
jgi:predicted transcriptional regulator